MTKVKLGDVVYRVKEKVDKDNTNLTEYVGGEHFDEDEVLIRRKGTIKGSTIGPAFHMKFNPGDVLLMSRNPHLRKASVVDFEGICSDVSYVIRTRNENIIMQEFIPLLFQSDAFWEFAEDNKKGSTNFFLNWSDFEKYEFYLPSINRQKELVDLLWPAIKLRYSYKDMLIACDRMIQAQFIDMFGNCITNNKNYTTMKLNVACPFNTYKGEVEKIDEKLWLLNLDMIESNTGKLISRVLGTEDEIGSSTLKFDTNCVLYSKLRPYLNKVIIPDMSGYCTTELVYMHTDEKRVNKEFLASLLRSDLFVDYINAKTAGAKMPRVSMEILRNFDLIIPPYSEQVEFSKIYKQLEKTKSDLYRAISDLGKLYKSLLNDKISKED